MPRLKKHDHGFLKKAQRNKQAWEKRMEEQGTRNDKPMKPQVVGWELGKRIPENAIVVSDSGTITTWWARFVPARRGQKHSCSGNLASMACGLALCHRGGGGLS